MLLSPFLIWVFLGLAQGRTIRSPRSAKLSSELRSNCTSAGVYNSTYPLSTPSTVPSGTKYRIALISDLDKNSKEDKNCSSECSWISYLQKGYLIYKPTKKKGKVQWDKEPVQMSSEYSWGGRGMELSELVVFNGKLLSVDDRTGIIYELDDLYSKIHPWVIMSDGDGHSPKGLKAEWATVKDETLYVGGHGNPIITPGKVIYDPLWIKTVSKTGEVTHFNWKNNYARLLDAQQIKAPGYSMYESGLWSPVNERWYFLPRKSSKKPYDRKSDEQSGSNILLSADPDFSDITVTRVGEIIPTRGYSTVKFIPGTNDTAMVALKVEEMNETTSTYITVFTTAGKIVLPDTKVADYKYEGIEFV